MKLPPLRGALTRDPETRVFLEAVRREVERAQSLTEPLIANRVIRGLEAGSPGAFATSQQLADLETSLNATIAGKADASTLTAHTSDSDIHQEQGSTFLYWTTAVTSGYLSTVEGMGTSASIGDVMPRDGRVVAVSLFLRDYTISTAETTITASVRANGTVKGSAAIVKAVGTHPGVDTAQSGATGEFSAGEQLAATINATGGSFSWGGAASRARVLATVEFDN